MGVDVYLKKDIPKEILDYIERGKKIGIDEKALKYMEKRYTRGEWVMQFSTAYSQWLCWIITASGEDPSRINHCYPDPNKRFLKLVVHGHPWGEIDEECGHFDLDYHDCVELKCDLEWFIENKMPMIEECEYLKGKTTWFLEAVQRAIKENGKLRLG